jgi:hypothetical protein
MNPEEIVKKIESLLNRFPTPRDMEWLFSHLEKQIKKAEKNKTYHQEYYQKNKDILDQKHADYRKTHPEYRDKARQNTKKYYHGKE